MARLSKSVRESMAKALVAHRYAEEAKQLVAESVELFRQLYDWHYDDATRRHMAAIIKKHPQGLSSTTGFRVVVGGQRIPVGAQSFGKRPDGWGGYWDSKVTARRSLADLEHSSSDLQVPRDHPLAERILSFGSDAEKLKADTRTAFSEAMGALNTFGTGKRLADEWPEAMPVIAGLIPDEDRSVPVLQVGRLNDKFKLPPHAKKAA